MKINHLPIILFFVLFSAFSFSGCSKAERKTSPVNSESQTNSSMTNEIAKQEQQADSIAKESSAETAKTNESIVGKWKDVKAGTVVQFFKEGTVLIDDAASGQRITGKYQRLDETDLKLSLDLPMSRPAVVKYKIVGNKLELGNPDGSAGMSNFSRIQQ